ncbi:hypothetical protein MKX03_001123, partial [Papaver bracteatum]
YNGGGCCIVDEVEINIWKESFKKYGGDFPIKVSFITFSVEVNVLCCNITGSNFFLA